MFSDSYFEISLPNFSITKTIRNYIHSIPLNYTSSDLVVKCFFEMPAITVPCRQPITYNELYPSLTVAYMYARGA